MIRNFKETLEKLHKFEIGKQYPAKCGKTSVIVIVMMCFFFLLFLNTYYRLILPILDYQVFNFKFNLVSTNIRVVIKVHFRENFNSRFFSWYFLSLCGQLLFCVVILIHFLRQFSIELISFKITTILNEVLLLALKPAIFFFFFHFLHQ